jgi:hypothetical protein
MSGAINGNNPRIGYKTFAVFGTVTAEQEQTDYPITNALNGQTFSQWRGVTPDEQSIYITTPDAQTADYIGVYGHNWGSTNTTVHLEYSLDAVTWLPAILPTIPDANDKVFFLEFDTVTADLWRIRLVPPLDAIDPPEASVIYLGEVLTIPRRIYVGHTPLPYGREIEVGVGTSTNGQFLGRVLESVMFRTGVNFENLDPTFYREEFDPFVRACLDRPFFWAWRPQRYDTETAFAWFSGNSVPVPQNQRENGWMSVSFNLEGVTQPPHLRAGDSSSSSS